MTKKRILKKKAKQNKSSTDKLRFFATECRYPVNSEERINKDRIRTVMESGRYDF